MKKKIERMRIMAALLDNCNWSDKKLAARYHALGKSVAMELALPLTALANLGMISICAFRGENTFVTFNAESAVPNGVALQINCELDVAEVSHPKPRGIKLPGLEHATMSED